MLFKKQILFLSFTLAVSGFLPSCESNLADDSQTESNYAQQQTVLPENEAQKAFARILSVAADKYPSVRTFLKNEALKQYDRDYDVFYPYVKDRVIESGRSFRDILVSCSSESEIKTIENSVPLLTVMIPDLSSFDAFSVKTWNTSDEQLAVTYATGNDNSVFYADGDSLLELPKGSLPDFPFMVVKSNERMKVISKAVTRGGVGSQYDFADPAFDGTKSQGTRASNYDLDSKEAEPDDKPYLKASELDSRCIEAYKLSKNNKYLIDREYVYYNLSPQNPENGRLDPNIREKFYKFRISPNRYYNIIDKYDSPDPRLKDEVFYRKGLPSDEQIAKDLWTNGAYEFEISAFMGNTNVADTKIIPVKGADLFYISKFHVRHKHKTAFRHSKWWYSTSPEYLKGKWVDISSQNVYLTHTWDLSNSPVNIYIKMLEMDEDATTTITQNYTANYVYGLNGKIGSEKNNLKVELGFSSQVKSEKTYTISYQYSEKDDKFGKVLLNFNDPIIVSDKLVSSKGYEMYSMNTGSIDLVIAPVSIR